MSALLRDASPQLKAVLASGVPIWVADLFTITLADGATVLHWTSWDVDLNHAGVTHSSRGQWLSRTSWKVNNTMEVPSMTMKLMSLNNAFRGGAHLKSQIHAGLLDGAKFLLQRAIMTSPGDCPPSAPLAQIGG